MEYLWDIYPPVVKQGLLENSPSINDVPSYKPLLYLYGNVYCYAWLPDATTEVL
jgi:hypothetical protein